MCAIKRRWATNGTSLGVTNSGIWQCEQAELKKWAYDWFSRRALASAIFPTAPFQKPLSKFLRRSLSVPHHDLSCFRPPLPPSSSSLNVFPSDNSPTPTSAAATRTFRGREAARRFFAMDPASVHELGGLGGTYRRYKMGQAKFTAWLREAAGKVTSKPEQGTDPATPSSPVTRTAC